MEFDGQAAVYLDVTHIPRETLDRKLEGILEIYEKFLGVDPRDRADEGFSGDALHDGRHLGECAKTRRRTFREYYAAGECEYQYHGANRLGANSLVSCIFGGGLAGPAAVKYARESGEAAAEAVGSGVFERERKRQEEKNQALISPDGTENPITIWRELGETDDGACDRDADQQKSGGR